MTVIPGTAGRGRFITFEGGEGSGKSTQIRRLDTMLRMNELPTITTREPGGSPTGEKIRGLLLDPAAKLDAMTQILLFCAARHDHVVELISPALARGQWVLCDRFADSTRAYQGAAGHIDAEMVRMLERAAIGQTIPDLTIILDIAPDKGLARANKRRGEASAADAFEASDLAFHQRVREGYRAIAAAEPARCVIIDADQSEDAVASAVAGVCGERFGLRVPAQP
jgi:dTMP kinase